MITTRPHLGRSERSDSPPELWSSLLRPEAEHGPESGNRRHGRPVGRAPPATAERPAEDREPDLD
jgi:hypothetical protein